MKKQTLTKEMRDAVAAQIGRGLRMARASAGMSLIAAATKAGWKQHQQIGQWEKGAHIPSTESLTLMASVYMVPVDQIILMGTTDFAAGERLSGAGRQLVETLTPIMKRLNILEEVCGVAKED